MGVFSNLLAVSLSKPADSLLWLYRLSGELLNFRINLSAEIHNESHQVEPQHQDDNGSKAAVDRLITWRISQIQREKIRDEYKCRYRKQRTRGDLSDALIDVGSEIVDAPHAKNEHGEAGV